MKLFNTLCLEINARCNRKCKFCPVAYNTRPDELMENDLICKALHELSRLKYKGRIEFYIYNEPMKNREHLEEILRYTREEMPKACLMIATNGDYIKSAMDVARLFDCGLNQLLINCYSPGLYERRLPWIEALPPTISRTKSVYAVLPATTKTVQMLDKSSPEVFGTGIFRLVNRAGNIAPYMEATAEPLERMCVKPFRLLNINWKGEALVCCQDYHGDVSYGNLATSTLVQLWEHPVMNAYRKALLTKDRSLPLCRGCDCHAGAYPHNVPAPQGPYAAPGVIGSMYRANVAKRAVDALGATKKPPHS